jgi:cytoskeletal protein CcmA (bactofilin family)
MDNHARNNITINGSGSSGGGLYDKVTINGDGRINGDVECEKFTTNGSSQIHGNIKALKLTTNGSTHVYGNVLSEKMSVNGHSDIDGQVVAREIKVAGDCTVGGNLSAETMKHYGSIHVHGNCEVEDLTARGGFTIGGLLNVGTMDLKLGWHCKATEIGGERIIVRKSNGIDMAVKSVLRMFKIIPDAVLTANTIEGDDVILEATKASIVRGNHVEIGPGCEIDLVEYRGTYNQSPDARVNRYIQI